MPRIEGVERRLAVVEVEQRDRGHAEHDVGAPHRQPRRQLAGVARLLAEPDQHVVDEDHADRQREGGRARLLLAAERQRQPEQPEHQAGRRDRELLVPLDREAAPLRARLVLRAQVGHALLQLRQRHLAVALREQQLLAVREELVDRQVPAHRAEAGAVVGARLAAEEAVLAPCPELDAHGLLLFVDDEIAGLGEDQLGFGDVAGVVDQQVLPAPPARRPGRRASSGPAAPSR